MVAQKIRNPEHSYFVLNVLHFMGTWVLGNGQGYVRTKEINVSHIISVCLVVIARKRENILSRQKLLQVAFSRQDAIVQQQKSSADVKTAINVTNMTLVFLFVMKMMGMARAIG